ncbi:MAG: hypothetical protein IJI49_00620 [Bacilli bacterium]|nr:hypothetical protein [Bacilli bacterium]
MKNRIISLLFIFYILFFSFCFNVNAISFTHYGSSDEICYNRDKFTYLSNSYTNCNSSHDHRKWVNNGKKDTLAYCATRRNKFDKESKKYQEDSEWRSNSNCKYKVGGTGELKSDGDCSIIAGFVINRGLADTNTSKGGKKQSWFNAQTSLWVYLRNYAPYPYYVNNSKDANNELYNLSDYARTKKILEDAWKAYTDFKNANGNVSSTKSSKINFELNTLNAVFDFIASGSNDTTCNTSGYYKTNDIIIKNNESKAINISIANNWKGVQICRYTSGSTQDCTEEDMNISLNSGDNLKLYLYTKRNNINKITLSITADFKEIKNSSVDYYNTKMYKPICYNSAKDEVECKVDGEIAQNMLVAEEKNANNKITINHKETRKINVTQRVIQHEVCPIVSDSVLKNVYGEHNESDPVTKTCKSSLTDDQATDDKNYVVNFNGCSCHPLQIGSGQNTIYVSVILIENVKFKFGAFDLKNTYSGGGFGLVNSGNDATNYISNLEWYFADHDSLDNPYYYQSGSGKIASSSSEKVSIENVVRDKLKNELLDKMKDKESLLALNVVTKDSNNYSKNDYKTELNIIPDSDIEYHKYTSSDNKGKKVGVFIANDTNVEMKEAFFNSNGEVSYEKGKKGYSVSGGNKYYTPLNYDINKSFPYNIATSNLSMTGWFKFYYKAECGIDVNEFKYDVSYRTIDVSDPFPKKIPTNWVTWWDNSNNKSRMNNTFALYPNGKIVYKAELSDSDILKISSNDKVYTSWTGINDNGSNNFINSGNGFKTINNQNSYCNIGEFNESCDK